MKETKTDAGYKVRAYSDDYRCAKCTMFRAPHGCTTVMGKIDPKAVCDYFEPK